MPEVELQNRDTIAAYLSRDRALNVYQLGDLDEYYWPDTRWFGWENDGNLEAMVLYFTGLSLPTLISVDRTNMAASRKLLSKLSPALPDRFYAHLQADHIEPLLSAHDCSKRSSCIKMTLQSDVVIEDAVLTAPVALSTDHAVEMLRFYDRVYPQHWFEPHMLEAGYYYGFREMNELIAVAGVHVVSRRYRVAALGNIATAPEYRDRGLATGLTLHLCHQLRRDGIDMIGLNVGRGNKAARATYERVGFKITCEYDEMLFTKRVPGGGSIPAKKSIPDPDDESANTNGA